MKYMLVVGNPLQGLQFVGPFDSADDAAEHMFRSGMEPLDWWVGTLVSPDTQDDNVNGAL